jgi:hypothetical protein
MSIFAEASGLLTNLSKTECFPIQCANINLNFLDQANLVISQFPCTYLELPLHHRKPARAMLQPLIQKIGGRLPDWKINFFILP